MQARLDTAQVRGWGGDVRQQGKSTGPLTGLLKAVVIKLYSVWIDCLVEQSPKVKTWLCCNLV